MISFEISEEIREQKEYAEKVSREQIRPYARYYDEHEHEVPWDFVKFIWEEARYHIGCLLPGSMDLEEPFMSRCILSRRCPGATRDFTWPFHGRRWEARLSGQPERRNRQNDS